MNRQPMEEEMHVAELLQDLQRHLGHLHYTDESFLENVQTHLPKMKKVLDEIENYLKE
ncbi:hypothetical protein [Fictibacillus gelatini]|uniref:hypothetical protein n=1 Tax=Fictibacillus gelatini TaxID=225985 RepID=UPI000402280F|nr:hypothetical protein [Fictibacillus gelatini]